MIKIFPSIQVEIGPNPTFPKPGIRKGAAIGYEAQGDYVDVTWDNFLGGHNGTMHYTGLNIKPFSVYAVYTKDLVPNTVLEAWISGHSSIYPQKKVVAPVSYPSKFGSQKAKGIYHLSKSYYREFSRPDAQFYPQTILDIYKIDFPKFARPCPTVPRHGFVDSRLVNNKEEFTGLIKEIEKTGEPTEIILMDFLKPDYSGILTPSSVTIGLGHDGATSGTSAKVIPALTDPKHIADHFGFTYGVDLGIKKPDVPYGEFVGKFSDIQPTIVQLRAGPALTGSTLRYVPEQFEVKAIERATGDLLEWETKVTTFKPGTVVYHPNGSLSSHYAVHCILHKIPVLIDREPQIGEVLEPENEVKELGQADYNTLAQYLAHAITKPVTQPRADKLKTAVASLHASPFWDNQNHLLALRADGAATVFRYAAAACFGELRHFSCHGPGGDHATPIEWDGCRTFNREFVFKQVYRHNIRALLEALPLVIKDYQQQGWSGAYGGKKWAECSIALYNLGQGIQNFLHNKNAKTWKQVVSGWNQTVNAVHNGGGLLTKHIDSHFLDTVAVNPSIGFVNPYAAKLVLNANHYGRNLKPGKALPKHSRKPALELYPFTLKTVGFRKTFRSKFALHGTFQANFKKVYGTQQYKATLPHVSTISRNPRKGASIGFSLVGVPTDLNNKSGTVHVRHGFITKLWQDGKLIKKWGR